MLPSHHAEVQRVMLNVHDQTERGAGSMATASLALQYIFIDALMFWFMKASTVSITANLGFCPWVLTVFEYYQ